MSLPNSTRLCLQNKLGPQQRRVKEKKVGERKSERQCISVPESCFAFL